MDNIKSDHYVYVHRRNDNNNVFYIGSGRANRAYQKQSNKTKDWVIVNNAAGGHYVELLAENLTKQQSLSIEEYYILNPESTWRLVNKNLPTKVIEIDLNVLSGLFYYDTSSPSGLRYKQDRYKNKGAVSKYAHEIAGRVKYNKNKTPRGWAVKFTHGGVKLEMQVHRIIWQLLTLNIDNELVIDHINGNPLDNRQENLRQVTYESNARNKKLSGLVGVLDKKLAWVADCKDSSTYKGQISFSKKKYGEETARYLAVCARLSAIEDSNFSELHLNREALLNVVEDYRSKHLT